MEPVLPPPHPVGARHDAGLLKTSTDLLLSTWPGLSRPYSFVEGLVRPSYENSWTTHWTRQMGTSFVEFGGFGFWARDSSLELWLCLVAREIDKEVVIEEWKATIREHFVVQATAGFNGCVTALSEELQQLLSENPRRQWLIDLSERAFAGLRSHSPLAKGEWLNAVMEIEGRVGIPTVWHEGPRDISPIISVGEKWLLLLKGSPPLGPKGQWDAIQMDPCQPTTRH
jgi:hypothetical protein